MAQTSLSKPSYLQLITEVKSTLASGLKDTQRLIEYQRVKTYWTIGARILKAAAAPDGSITLNQDLYRRISRDVRREAGLDLTANTIMRCVQFGKIYPRFPEKTPLSFTHYLSLMRIRDPKKRLTMEQAAVQKDLSVNQLKARVNRLNAPPVMLVEGREKRLKVERGEPYIYFLREAAGLKEEEARYIDCGFKIEIPVGGAIGLQARQNISGKGSRYVRSVKTARGYEAKLAVRKRACVYTYPARVLKVVDGDTIDVRIDVGFGIRVSERVRLRGIDAPETTSHAGQAAKRFLEKYLSRCPMIVVRTQKAGMYGRWLGDLFALEGADDPFHIAAEGEYVNQMMIDSGHARLYQ